jgi:hypothetical protein
MVPILTYPHPRMHTTSSTFQETTQITQRRRKKKKIQHLIETDGKNAPRKFKKKQKQNQN